MPPREALGARIAQATAEAVQRGQRAYPGQAGGEYPAEPIARRPKLTAAEAAAVLGVTQAELTAIADRGLLEPSGPDAPGARRYSAVEVERVLNGRIRESVVVPMRGRPPAGATGPGGNHVPGSRPHMRGRGRPPGSRTGRRPGRGAPRAAVANSDTSTDEQAAYLRALSEAMAEELRNADVGQGAASAAQETVPAAGEPPTCEMRYRDQYPFLPYLYVAGVDVWAVSTSAGWRFLWKGSQSHPVSDPAGAAAVIVRDLGLGAQGTGD